jgi:alkanesulfonate monooxygenase SsuD/methylene tetrahydromethanopterin reductase-like flavin-dependent oxidoreductase (luciferase family)
MAGQISDRMLDQLAVVGSHDQIVAKIKERWGSTVKGVSLAILIRNEDGKKRMKTVIRRLQTICTPTPVTWG